MARYYVHIGLHKTGTTSLQMYFRDNPEWLFQSSKHYPDLSEEFGAVSHFGLNIATLDDDRDSVMLMRLMKSPGFSRDNYRQRLYKLVDSIAEDHPEKDVILSNEGLSLLRFSTEMERLKALLAARETTIIVCLRNRKDYLRSYRAQMIASGHSQIDRPFSAFEMSDNSWLLDFDALLDLYRDGFGDENLRVVDYDEAVRQEGSVLPAMLRAFDLDPAKAPDTDKFWLNKRSPIKPHDMKPTA